MWILSEKVVETILDLRPGSRSPLRSRGHGTAVITSKVDVQNPGPYVGKLVVTWLLVGSFQYRTLTNCMYWFPLPTKLPVMI